MDEFQSPVVDEPLPPGQGLDVGRAVSEAVGAALANGVSAVGVVALTCVVSVVSVCTCVGWIPTLPIVVWGIYAWMLEAHGGKARVATLWTGGDRFGTVFGRMWGYFGILFVLSLPVTGVIMALTLPASLEAAMSGEQADPISQTLLITAVSVAWSLLIVRIVIAPFYMVERDLGPVEALTRAWDVTRGQWGRLIVLQLLFTVLNLPSQVLAVGLQLYAAGIDQDNPQEALDALPTIMAMYAVMFGLTVVVVVLGQLMFASAYRQLSGPAPGGSVAA